MNPRGISIAGLSGFIILIGTGFAALRIATVAWTNVASTVVLALLLTAVAGAIFVRGPERAYWTGFAIFGWTYLLFVNGSWIGGQFGHDLTSGLGELAESMIPVETPSNPADRVIAMELLATRSVKVGNFVQIGRLFLALLFAIIGGLVARAFACRAEPFDHRDPTPAERSDRR